MIDYSISEKFKVQYRTAKPFPYIVIDNFLPEFLLQSCLNEIKKHDEWYTNQLEWVEKFEVNKLFYPTDNTDMTKFSQNFQLPIWLLNI